MVKTIFDDLFGEDLEDFDGLFKGLNDLFGSRKKGKPPETAPPPNNDDKLIEALGKCQAEYKASLSRIVVQTATHVKHENTNQRLVDAYVRAAVYTGLRDLGREALDAVVLPNKGQQELRSLFHYEQGNIPLTLDLFGKFDGKYQQVSSRYAHASTLYASGARDISAFERILGGLDENTAPAVAMIAVIHFNTENYAHAALHFDRVLHMKPSDRTMLNFMTARAWIEESRADVIREYAPRLYGELRYTGSLAELESELGRREIQFPRLKLKMNVEMVDSLLK